MATLQVNKLSLNVNKTKLMVFHTPQKIVNFQIIKLNDKAVEPTNDFKDAVQVRLHFTYNVQRYATVW